MKLVVKFWGKSLVYALVTTCLKPKMYSYFIALNELKKKVSSIFKFEHIKDGNMFFQNNSNFVTKFHLYKGLSNCIWMSFLTIWLAFMSIKNVNN